MPRKITQADIDHVWNTYEAIHGRQPLTEEEVIRGVKVLLRCGGVDWSGVAIKFVTGRNKTHFVSQYQFNVNLIDGGWGFPTTWRHIVHSMAWRCTVNDKRSIESVELKLARRACEGNFLVGALKPVPVEIVKPTKEEIRAEKIERLKIRRITWEKRLDRAQMWLRKIDRSLNAYRRHEK